MFCLQIFWKLDFIESSSRMRRFLKRNYRGSAHLGAAADYEERQERQLHLKIDQAADACLTNGDETSITAELASSASIVMAEAISLDNVNEDDEQIEADIVDNSASNKQILSSASNQSLKEPLESRCSGASTDQHLVPSTSLVAPGYLPNETDERIVFELPSLLVRPLKVVQGTFQVSIILDQYASAEALCLF